MSDNKIKASFERVVTRRYSRMLKVTQVEHSYARRPEDEVSREQYRHKKFNRFRIENGQSSTETEFEKYSEYVHKKFNKIKQMSGDFLPQKRRNVSDVDIFWSSTSSTSNDSPHQPPQRKSKICRNLTRMSSFSHSQVNNNEIPSNNKENYESTSLKSPENSTKDGYEDLGAVLEYSPSQRSNSVILNIPVEKIVEICKYNPNMARKFPPKQRTEQEQERRRRNTEACRVSRRKRKLEDLARDQIIDENTKEYFKDLRYMLQTLYHVQFLKSIAFEEIRKTEQL